MAKLFVAIYRTGGTDNFEWKRALPVPTAEEAKTQVESLRRMGYAAHYEDYARSMAIGLPDTFA
jgi:hypothetical protein